MMLSIDFENEALPLMEDHKVCLYAPIRLIITDWGINQADSPTDICKE